MPRERKKPALTFMTWEELRDWRVKRCRMNADDFCSLLVDPASGKVIPRQRLLRWETGRTPVPLWAARKVRSICSIEEKKRKNG